MRVWLKFAGHGLEFEVVAAHQSGLLEFKSELLGCVHVVQNNESIRDLRGLKLAKVNALVRECGHLTILTHEGPALWQVFVELDFSRNLLRLLWVVALTAQLEHMLMVARAFDVADLDRQVDGVVLRLQGSEQGVDVLRIVGCQLTLRILNLKDPEVVVVRVQCLQLRCINTVVQFRNTKVLHLDRIRHGPVQSDGSRRQMVDVLEQPHVRPSMKRFSLEVDDHWLAVRDLEEGLEMMSLHLFRIVEYV